jgi:glutaredoxin
MAKKTITKITCPHCNKSITLDEAITHSIEEKLSNELEKKYNLDNLKDEIQAYERIWGK